jgi:hypothetical protein
MFAAKESRPYLMPSLDEIRDGLHISYSQLNTYLLCPLKFQFAYVLGLQPEFVPVALPFGSAFHQGIELLYKTVQITDHVPSLQELQEAFAAHWASQEEAGKGYVRLKNDETWASLKDLGVKLIEAYYTWLQQKGMPTAESVVAVEQPLRVALDENIDFIGVVDVMLRDTSDHSLYRLIDLKTAARRYDEAKIASDNQLTAYKFLLDRGGFLPEDAQLTLSWQVALKLKKPAIEEYVTVREDRDVRRFEKLTHLVLRALDQDVFYPNPGWACEGCGHQAACRSW